MAWELALATFLLSDVNVSVVHHVFTTCIRVVHGAVCKIVIYKFNKSVNIYLI